MITSLGEPPVVDGPALVLAVGWISRLPSDRLEWRHGSWWEIRLAAAAGGGDQLSELAVPRPTGLRRRGEHVARCRRPAAARTGPATPCWTPRSTG